MTNEITIILALLAGGGVGVAIIGGVREYLAFKRERKAKKEDQDLGDFITRLNNFETRTDERLSRIERLTQYSTEANKFLLYDRIKHLGQSYIRDKEIDIDDQTTLNQMHEIYEEKLGDGMGDLSHLMKAVNSLPIKSK